MAFRIIERQMKRDLMHEQKRLAILNQEAQKYVGLKWQNLNADQEFLEKLQDIRNKLGSNGEAKQLAKDLESKISEKDPTGIYHQNLLASVIVELL
ncbi:MAG: hypothetical protein HRU19_08815 [Pseudobacteriovorax sp.]|nr:hypothetical protein [Pseudobacteriovorax sp.]